MTQTAKLVHFLRDHPGSTSLELTLALGIVNVTGRVSDARKEGHVIECRKRYFDQRHCYWLVEKPVQLAIGMAS